MPKLISQVNSSGQVGIQSDGTSIGNASKINFENNRVTVTSGIASVTSDPISVIGLYDGCYNLTQKEWSIIECYFTL